MMIDGTANGAVDRFVCPKQYVSFEGDYQARELV